MYEIWASRRYIFMIPDNVAFDTILTIDDLRIYMLIRAFMYETSPAIIDLYNMLINVVKIHRLTFNNCIKRLIEEGYIEEEEINGKICLKVKFK